MKEHKIEGSRLVSRKAAKARFRESIFNAWGWCCAYCGEKLGKNGTLDHIIPKFKGGETKSSNLCACCFSCNSHKSGNDVFEWYRKQDFFDPEKEKKIKDHLNQ